MKPAMLVLVIFSIMVLDMMRAEPAAKRYEFSDIDIERIVSELSDAGLGSQGVVVQKSVTFNSGEVATTAEPETTEVELITEPEPEPTTEPEVATTVAEPETTEAENIPDPQPEPTIEPEVATTAEPETTEVELITEPEPEPTTEPGHGSGKHGNGKHGWGYHNEKEWGNIGYPSCTNVPGKSRQSPINIDLKDLSKVKRGLKVRQAAAAQLLKNNGHSAQLSLVNEFKFRNGYGPGSTDKFRALQLHFHWGSVALDATNTDEINPGSEHTVSGKEKDDREEDEDQKDEERDKEDNKEEDEPKRFPAEMHIVTVNTKYPTNPLSKLLSKPDGLLVIGAFIDIYDESDEKKENEEFEKISDKLENINASGGVAHVMDTMDLMKLLPKSFPNEFYHYQGSLTTPPCSETAQWVIATDPIRISLKQFKQFQKLMGPGGIDDIRGKNHRQTQNLNGRTVFKKETSDEDDKEEIEDGD